VRQNIRKTIPWGVLTIAISVIIVLAIGSVWFFKNQPEKKPIIDGDEVITAPTKADTDTLNNNKPIVTGKGDTSAIIKPARNVSSIKKRRSISKRSIGAIAGTDSSVNLLSSKLDKETHPVAETGKKEESSLGEMMVMSYNTRKRANAKAQTDSIANASVANEKAKTIVVTKNKQEAHPQTGFSNFEKYLNDEAVSPDNMTGTVSLSFMVSSEGMLSDFKVLKSVSDAADQKAIALIKNGPGWLGNTNGQSKMITVKIKFHKAVT
jgi:cytoskeletal protein RodZ